MIEIWDFGFLYAYIIWIYLDAIEDNYIFNRIYIMLTNINFR